MKKSLLFLLFLLPAALFAQKAIEIKLWPDGAPNDNGILQEDLTDPDYPKNTREAILYVYPAEKGNGLSVVACPGGGYSILAMHHEGTDMAAWFNSQGITYAVLRYRMPNGHDEVPLSDVHQAIRVMRSHADDWQVKKVGVMGASAGGHLASTAATHFDAETRPDFQILFYPVISMDPKINHRGSRINLLGQNPSAEKVREYSNELQVTPQTPPAFIMHSSDDTAVPVANSLNYFQALVNIRYRPAVCMFILSEVTDGDITTASPTSANGPANWKNGCGKSVNYKIKLGGIKDYSYLCRAITS